MTIYWIDTTLDHARQVFDFLLSVHEQGFWPVVISVHYFNGYVDMELGYTEDPDWLEPKKIGEGYDQMYHRP